MAESKTPAQPPYDKLEAATRTLAKERQFFESLLDARPVALVVNRIVHLVTFFRGAETWIPQYLERHADRLFPTDSMEVAAVLAHLLEDVARSARLAAYLCVKGIPDQALATLRAAVEQIGVYAHVWRAPSTYRFVPDSDSDDYGHAFRHPPPALVNELRACGVKFRFKHCHGAKPLSDMYSMLSEHFVHGTTFVAKDLDLSCDFVDRGAPESLAMQYQLVQAIMALVYYEIFLPIPEDDRLCDELAALSLASGLLLPVLSFASDTTDPELKCASDQLLAALGTARIDDGP